MFFFPKHTLNVLCVGVSEHAHVEANLGEPRLLLADPRHELRAGQQPLPAVAAGEAVGLLAGRHAQVGFFRQVFFQELGLRRHARRGVEKEARTRERAVRYIHWFSTARKVFEY